MSLGVFVIAPFVLMFLLALGGIIGIAVVKLIQMWPHAAPLVLIPVFAGIGLILVLFLGIFSVRAVSTANYRDLEPAIRVEHEWQEWQAREIARAIPVQPSALPQPPSPLRAPPPNDLRPDPLGGRSRDAKPVSAAAPENLRADPLGVAVARTVSIPATDDRSTLVDAASAPTPDWVRAGVQRKGDVTVLVCSSKQYATEQEADVDARAAVREYLAVEQRRAGPDEPFRLRTQPAIDDLLNGIVKDRYVETVQRDFGSMFATMYRVWLRAEISPATYQRMHQAQLANLQEGRMLVAGSALGALLSIPLGIVSYGQLNRWSSRRFRGIWKGAVTAGIVAIWMVAFVFVQRAVTFF